MVELMKHMHMLWTFNHKDRTVEFGPYYYEDEAKSAFQRAYGYWPESAISSRPWDGITDTTKND